MLRHVLELRTVTRTTEAVNLGIISVEVGVQAIRTHQAEQVSCVEQKEDWPKDRPLRDSTCKLGRGRRGSSTANMLETTTEVWLEPVMHATRETVRPLQPGQQCFVVHVSKAAAKSSSARTARSPPSTGRRMSATTCRWPAATAGQIPNDRQSSKLRYRNYDP